MKILIAKSKREVFIASVLAISILTLWNGLFENAYGIYMLESIILAVYLICMEVPGYRLNQKENQIYSELLVFFSRVKHRYTACHNISNAVTNAAEGMAYEVQQLADEIVRILYENNRKEKVREYIENNRKNRFLKLFLIQAYEASEQGNQYFSENVEHLRLDLMEEIHRRKRRSFEFSGYVFVAVTPFFMMPILKQWGKDFTPELELFYAGIGILLEAMTFILSFFIYGIIMKAKETTFFTNGEREQLVKTEHFYNNKFVSDITRCLDSAKGKFSCFIRQLLLRSGENISYGRFCFRILMNTFCFFVIFFLAGSEIHRKERDAILYGPVEMAVLLPVANDEKKEKIEAHIVDVVRKCIDLNVDNEEHIKILLKEKVHLHNEAMEETVVKEIQNRILQYKKIGLTFTEIVIFITCSFGIGLFPIVQLLLQTGKIRSEAVYEIRQFQSIILMERKLQGMTILGLLEDMEAFSRYYRNCLKRCINSYGTGSEVALVRLKEEGMALHESFEELADAFLSVDEVGIELAFEEIESNRRLLEKMVQLEAEFAMENKKDITDLLSKIPSLLALGGYFILPVFLYSMKGVYEIFEILEEMQL